MTPVASSTPVNNHSCTRQHPVEIITNKNVGFKDLNGAYRSLATDVLVKASIGALIGSILCFRSKTWVSRSACMGFGFGFGYSTKEASIFLKNPHEEKIPQTFQYINSNCRTLYASFLTVYNKLSDKKKP